MIPCKEIQDIMLPAYSPCPFSNDCSGVTWKPESGFIPRGYIGATGRPIEVELVLIMAEPGHPQEGEEQYLEDTPNGKMAQVHDYMYKRFSAAPSQHHKNIRYIIDGCFPDLPFAEQLKKVWVTEAILCSAPTAINSTHTPHTRKTCKEHYLEKQLKLFKNATIVALGGKAYTQVKNIKGILKAYAVAPPGCNYKPAKPSWDNIIDIVKQKQK